MPGGNGLFKSLTKSLSDPTAQPIAEPARVLSDIPMTISREGTHATDSASGTPAVLLQSRKWSQKDQNRFDEQTRKKIMKELVSSWMDRLQLISVITAFFAAIEAQLIGLVTPADKNSVAHIEQAASAALSSGLVVHVFAAILSFLAAFFLVRFRLDEAAHEELKVERGGSPSPKNTQDDAAQIFTTNPHLEAVLVGPFRKGHPPTDLLERCHAISMFLSLVGFLLALLGVIFYVWASLPASACVTATCCVLLCCGASLVAVFASSTKPSSSPKIVC